MPTLIFGHDANILPNEIVHFAIQTSQGVEKYCHHLFNFAYYAVICSMNSSISSFYVLLYYIHRFFSPSLWTLAWTFRHLQHYAPWPACVCRETPALAPCVPFASWDERVTSLVLTILYMQWQSVQFNPKGKPSPQSPIGNQRDEDAHLFVSCILHSEI